MASVTISRVVRVGVTDDVIAEGTVDGVPASAHLWLSHLLPLTAAQRRQAVAQALRDERAGADTTDLGISGTVTV